MLSPDRSTDLELLSINLLQAEGGSGDEESDSGIDSSKSSEGSERSGEPSGEKSSPTTPEENVSREVGYTRTPLEEMLKGLIISQIRAPFIQIEEGIINLVKECLIADRPYVTSGSLSGYVDHFQSKDDQDLGWGCGWRNIQILCSFLLAEDPEVSEVLLNGTGFVPDIPALQTWLEIAWAKGFDSPGADYFGWAIAGTRKWIGTTECAALLRSFGVRARIVSFTALGGKRVRGGLDTKHSEPPTTSLMSDNEQVKESLDMVSDGTKNTPGDNSRGGANVNDDSESPDEPPRTADTEPGDMSEKHITRPEDLEPSISKHNWHYYVCNGCGKPIEGRGYKSLMTRNFDLCSSCMKEVDDNPTKERGSLKDYVIIEEHPAIRNSGPPEEDQQWEEDSGGVDAEEAGIDQGETSEGAKEDSSWVEVDKEKVGAEGKQLGESTVEEKDIGSDDQVTESPEIATGPQRKKHQKSPGSKPLRNGERGKAGMQASFSEGDKGGSSISHQHLIQWVWSYFTDNSTERLATSSNKSRHFVNMSKRSPLYFQHRGHSRTIVGIERRGEPSPTLEDVCLLVLDPSVSTELLAKSLRGRSGWQSLIEYDVHSLRETEYQLCYVDRGIAVGEELEQLKVLSSLRHCPQGSSDAASSSPEVSSLQQIIINVYGIGADLDLTDGRGKSRCSRGKFLSHSMGAVVSRIRGASLTFGK